MKRPFGHARPQILLLAGVLAAAGATPEPDTRPAAAAATGPSWKTVAVLAAPEAYQAAAADGPFVYAIAGDRVGKYDRKSGKRLAVSTGDAHHLNSGFVHDGRVYCAHSNYPNRPERSQIMVLDPQSMRLTEFKDFGNFGGSLTWCVRRDGRWWCNFAKYGGENAKTFLTEFDDGWKELGRWTYPPELIRQLGSYSLSGGVWRDGLLVVTGHTEPVVFRLRLPKDGTVMELVDSQRVPFGGQCIADDPATGGLVGIDRDKLQVLFAVPESPATAPTTSPAAATR